MKFNCINLLRFGCSLALICRVLIACIILSSFSVFAQRSLICRLLTVCINLPRFGGFAQLIYWGLNICINLLRCGRYVSSQ